MTINDNMAPVVFNHQKLNNSAKVLAIRNEQGGLADYVPHLSPDEVRRLSEAVDERDRLLILLMFDACLRVSEAIGTRPCDFNRTPAGWIVKIMGKGSRPASAALSASLVAQIQAYAYRKQIAPTALIFPINRSRVFQIVTEAFGKSGLRRPGVATDRVGAVHILRHSGAIERLKRTGNPKAVQDQLRHKSANMTLKYLKTVSQDESLIIQQGVDYQW